MILVVGTIRVINQLTETEILLRSYSVRANSSVDRTYEADQPGDCIHSMRSGNEVVSATKLLFGVIRLDARGRKEACLLRWTFDT